MRHARIVEDLADRLGSHTALAVKLRVTNMQLSQWKVRGIPPKHWPKLLELAKRYRYRLTIGQLVAGPAKSEDVEEPEPAGAV